MGRTWIRFGILTACLVLLTRISTEASTSPGHRLPTGERISPEGRQDFVGSFPCNMVGSPDGRYLVVTDTGFREYLSVIDCKTGAVVSQIGVRHANWHDHKKLNLYYGLAFAPNARKDGSYRLYVSYGSAGTIGEYALNGRGRISFTGVELQASPQSASHPIFAAGIAVSGSGRRIYVTNNETTTSKGLPSSLAIMKTTGRRSVTLVPTPGFSYAVTAVTKGPDADQKVYVSSERDGVVSDVYVGSSEPAHIVRNIRTGDHPIALLLDARQTHLFVANAASGSVSIINTLNDHVLQTESLRGRSGLPGVTPTGLALNRAQTRLYVTLADKNAVAVFAISHWRLKLLGEVPTGWYPTAVASVGGRLFIANAKGYQAKRSNGKDQGPSGGWGRYIENILEGTVQVIASPKQVDLARLSAEVAANNRAEDDTPLPKTGIKHVIYIIKENRTYDQVLGDIPQGNGDPSLCTFGKMVTPNQHALALRFVLLDNYYCSAEVSTDGWYWCTEGMASEYVERNVPYNYSGRGRFYDFGGVVNGIPVSREGLPDVTEAPGGYLWDDAARSGVSYRNYGFFLQGGNYKDPKTGRVVLADNHPDEPGLVGHTDLNFRRLTFNFADSDAWAKYDCKAPTQRGEYGQYHSNSRVSEWLREFHEFVKHNDLPALEMVRFMRDHTIGTKPGYATPQAMVADNDYAVGRVVQAVSHSPYWKSTAIFVVEDDAQNGYDHVDCHRSTAYVISPYIAQHSIDHHFYTTDSILHTIESLLHMKPMCRYDANAPLIHDFLSQPMNDTPFSAILPRRNIVAALNSSKSYDAKISMNMDFRHADENSSQLLNAIIWHSIKGAHTPVPPVVHTLTARMLR